MRAARALAGFFSALNVRRSGANRVDSPEPAADVPTLGPAPLFRRQARHRAQLVIRSPDRARAIAAVRDSVEAVAAMREHGSASFAVDVDPQ